MKSEAAAATAAPHAAAWERQRERSSLTSMRIMRTIALVAGRGAARLLLWPISLWVVATAPPVRRHSQHYLGRVLGRKATWLDARRHIHLFLATVLDRVFLLQERFDQFEVQATGIEHIVAPFERGDGVLACGAHLGSFEALRMVGHDKGLEVAMIMYEENARLINETLAALAPKAKLRTIALGRVDAMLSLRRWLDGGGVAGMLADRTLPGSGARDKSVVLPFLGSPARFPDGPFRLAALLRRKVVFMAALYAGGNRYDMRFTELADFSQPFAAGEREAAIRAAVERYAATLESLCRESPYNWFNFYDFWAGAREGDTEAPAQAEVQASDG